MITKGTIVRHLKKPEWGLGVVVALAGPQLEVLFVDHERVKLGAKFADALLEVVDLDDVPIASPLRDPTQWATLEKRGGRRAGGAPREKSERAPRASRSTRDEGPSSRGAGSSAGKCDHCGKRLDAVLQTDNKAWRSCPGCSSVDGVQHVFRRYPEGFDRTPRTRPDDGSGLCSKCRGDHQVPLDMRRCGQVIFLR